jgi:hypothetical protein
MQQYENIEVVNISNGITCLTSWYGVLTMVSLLAQLVARTIPNNATSKAILLLLKKDCDTHLGGLVFIVCMAENHGNMTCNIILQNVRLAASVVCSISDASIAIAMNSNSTIMTVTMTKGFNSSAEVGLLLKLICLLL